jgi:hypothetical protein
VAFEKNLYSAPFRLIRQTLWLKATDTTVQLFREHELIAVHCRLRGEGRHSTLDEHMPPEAIAYKLQDPQWCLRQAEQIGPACLEVIERLFAHRVLDNLRAAQGIVRLGGRYGKARLDAACDRALSFDSPKYRTVKTILERGEDQARTAPTQQDSLPGIYSGTGRFQRDTAKLLH